MIPEHLESYEIGLVAWIFLLALFGIQGLISVWLEGKELKLGREKRPSESPIAVIAIGILTVAELVLAVSFIQSLQANGSPKALAIYAALIFFSLAAQLCLYRRYFIADEVIAQERDDELPW